MCSLGSAHRVTQALGIMVQMVTEVIGRSWKSLRLIEVHLYKRKFQKEPDSGDRCFCSALPCVSLLVLCPQSNPSLSPFFSPLFSSTPAPPSLLLYDFLLWNKYIFRKQKTLTLHLKEYLVKTELILYLFYKD